jgi:hypothetical protein
VGFLLIHIITEIIAGRSQAADAVVPFLDHGRTLYLGLGTVASDLFLLILVTGILRARFATVRPTWAWRALHSVAYLAWVMGILHGLLAGRPAKPYVDWSYGGLRGGGRARPRGAAGGGRAGAGDCQHPRPGGAPLADRGRRSAVDARRNGHHAGPGPGARQGRLPAAAAGAARRAPARDTRLPRAGWRCPPVPRPGDGSPSVPRPSHRS